MSLSTHLTKRFHGKTTGRKDRDGNEILYGDFVECHASWATGGRMLEPQSGWDYEVREVLFDEEKQCPTLWLKAINGMTDPDDWESTEVGYLIRITRGEANPRIFYLKENGLYDETCEFEWLATIQKEEEPTYVDYIGQSVRAPTYEELQEFLFPPLYGPGTNWDAVLDAELVRIHRRIDRIWEHNRAMDLFKSHGILMFERPEPHPREFFVSDYIRRKGLEVRYPNYLIGIDPIA
jgi:hypothetical protein